MNKKHFIKLAAALKGCQPIPENSDPVTAWKLTVRAVADVCASHNPRFDRARFLTACGMEGQMYKVVRFYFERPGQHRTIETGLTLEQAQEHCKNPETSSSTCTNSTGKARTRRMGPWFDGYEECKR